MLLWRWGKSFSNDGDTNVQFLPKRKLLLPDLGWLASGPAAASSHTLLHAVSQWQMIRCMSTMCMELVSGAVAIRTHPTGRRAIRPLAVRRRTEWRAGGHTIAVHERECTE
jgi:hypothetical protein